MISFLIDATLFIISYLAVSIPVARQVYGRSLIEYGKNMKLYKDACANVARENRRALNEEYEHVRAAAGKGDGYGCRPFGYYNMVSIDYPRSVRKPDVWESAGVALMWGPYLVWKLVSLPFYGVGWAITAGHKIPEVSDPQVIKALEKELM